LGDKTWVTYWAETARCGTSQTRWISFLTYLVQIIAVIIYCQKKARYLEHFIVYVTLGTTGIPCIQANIILCERIYRIGAGFIDSTNGHFPEEESLEGDSNETVVDLEGMEEGDNEISDNVSTTSLSTTSSNLENADEL
jgi:hypothetical protein